MLNVTFHGVRGSTPVPGPGTLRYGGNTACVALEVPGEDPILLDLGTGLRSWGATVAHDRPVRASALLTHLHFDHVQGLPLLEALERPGAAFDVFGPLADPPESGKPRNGQLSDAFGGLIRPPYFPVRTAELAADVRFHDVDDEELVVGGAKVVVRRVPHLGVTNGYRVEWGGATVAYVSDHQAPPTLDRVDHGVLELADGADLLIHDAQFTVAEWPRRADWGHSTGDYAVLVAREAGARRLALFHHDPGRDDDELDRVVVGARRVAERLGVDEVLAAAEGLTVSFDRP